MVIVRPQNFFERDFVELLLVTEQRRRLGIGRKLLDAAVGARGTDVIFTSTNESNWPMRALLEEGGWSLSGRLDGLDDGDPELVYFWKHHH
jgi:GNAT superfamily N-acetyltransferase